MKTVSLIKGRSYSGHGININRGETVSVEDGVADVLLASGYFGEGEFQGSRLLPGDLQDPPVIENQLDFQALIDNTDNTTPQNHQENSGSKSEGDTPEDARQKFQEDDSGEVDAGDAKSVSKMKKEELIAYAEKKEYDISNCRTVEEMKALIKELDTVAEPNEEG